MPPRNRTTRNSNKKDDQTDNTEKVATDEGVVEHDQLSKDAKWSLWYLVFIFVLFFVVFGIMVHLSVHIIFKTT